MSDVYELIIGDRAYSSWSLRGWLLFEAFGLSCQVKQARLYSDELPNLLRDYAPARTAPTIRTPDGVVMSESLAIAEELASRHPKAGLWPQGRARAVARVLAAEMHAGFGALRSHCPMNLRVSYEDCAPPPEVLADLARLEQIWAWSKAETTSDSPGPWLCGPYSVADAFFAPVAARIAGYNLPVGPQAAAYVAAHLNHGPFRRWRAMAQVDGADQGFYRRDYPQRPWPATPPLRATPAAIDRAENRTCPYSGKPITDALDVGGRVFGFCNPFCRDKTMADPEAWPAFMALYQS